MFCPSCRAAPESASGTFFFLVGPSGAGKDTLINGAKAQLAECGAFRFARRVITRAPSDTAEDHEAVSADAFAALEQDGAFCLTWSAYGLSYGIRSSVRDDLKAGRHVIANGSRGQAEAARAAFDRTQIIHITASPAILAARLADRGRESRGEIEERLLRQAATSPRGNDVTELHNDFSRQEGISALVDILGRHAPFCGKLNGSFNSSRNLS